MNQRLRELTKEMRLRPDASMEAVIEVQRQLGIQLPSSYVNFILEVNGAEGPIGGSYLALWPIEDLPIYNENGRFHEFLTSLVRFGGDGGGEAFTFDIEGLNTTTGEMPIIEIPLISGDREEAIICGSSFEEFLEFLYAGSS